MKRRFHRDIGRLLGLGCLSASFLGCAVTQNPGCSLTYVLAVGPNAATADHAAASPGNQAQFRATVAPQASSPGCPVPEFVAVVDATWTVSDAVDAEISSAAATNGLATCLNAALNPITVTAAYTANGVTQVTTSSLVCK